MAHISLNRSQGATFQTDMTQPRWVDSIFGLTSPSGSMKSPEQRPMHAPSIDEPPTEMSCFDDDAITPVSAQNKSQSSSRYIVPRSIVRRGLMRLDSIHSPGYPGELRTSLLLSALRRFDHTFGVKRSEVDRQMIVKALETSGQDYIFMHERVRWNSEFLFSSFRVELNVCERVFFIADISDSSTTSSFIVSGIVVLTILCSIGLWVASTVPSIGEIPCEGCPPEPQQWMKDLDRICIWIFTTEYMLRLLTIFMVRNELLQQQFLVHLLSDDGHEIVQLKHGIKRLLRWFFSPLVICDLLSVLPYWIEQHFGGSANTNFPWLRLFRFLRVSRPFKLCRLLNSDIGQLSDMNQLLTAVCRQAFPAFVMTFGLIFTALIVFSSLMHAAERGDWYPRKLMETVRLDDFPDAIVETGKFLRNRTDGHLEISPFGSIVEAAWWTLTTITMVGYGDVVPVKPVGKVVGVVTMLYGMMLLGLPIGIIGSQFSSEFDRMVTISRRRAQIVRERMYLPALHHRSNHQFSYQQKDLGSFGGESIASDDVCGLSKPDSVCSSVDSHTGSRGKSGRWSYAPEKTVRQRLQSIKYSRASRHTVLAHRINLPLNTKFRDEIRTVRDNFEDTMRIHGDLVGISAAQQHCWMKELIATRLCASAAFDHLSMRILVVILEAEQSHPKTARICELIRRSWHMVCLVCCQVAEEAENEVEKMSDTAKVGLEEMHRTDSSSSQMLHI